MKQFIISFEECRRILSKHKMLIIMLILLCTICFILLGQIISRSLFSMENIDEFTNTVGNTNYYSLHENLDDTTYYRYLSEENYKYSEMVNFINELNKAKSFTYMSICQQPIEIINGLTIPEECLYGYETGNSKDSIYKDETNKTIYSTQACQITKSVIEKFNISVESGSMFKDDNFIKYSEKIPVLLGNNYKNAETKIGDIFQADYLYEKKEFIVIGFIEKNAYFSNGNDVCYFDNLIVFPQIIPNENECLKYNKLRLLQMLNGTIITKGAYPTVNSNIQKILEKTNAPQGKNGIFVTDNNNKSDSELNTLLSMTDKVYNQFMVLVVILCIFAIISITITINGFIRENYYEFGVHLLVGSYMKTLKFVVLFTIINIIIPADIFSIVVLLFSNCLNKSILYMQIVILITIILSSIIPIIYLKNIKLNELLGGKE